MRTAARSTSSLIAGLAIVVAGCGRPSTPPAAAPEAGAPPVQLGPPASGTGTASADVGEIQPVDPATFHKEPGYSPYAGRNYPERPYFGDQHLHTAWSVDAGGTGTSLDPEAAK
jgi:hypothetical protein